MSKKIKIGIKNNENFEFEILEDAKKGDFFCLKEINEIDFSDLKKQIENKENDLVNKKLQQEKENWTNEFKLSNDYRSLVDKIHQLEKINEKLQSDLHNKVELAISNTRIETQKEISDLKNEIASHKLIIENEKNKISLEKDRLISDLENKKNEEINELKIKMSNADKDKELALQANNNEWELKLKDRENELNNSHKEELERIERKKESNVKTLGEDLENWIQNEYNLTFGMIDGCSLEKTTKNIGGHKPDFLFSVYDNKTKQILGKVTIEAKTQMSVSETQKKNKDHFAKLEMDRNNHDSEFALLVSELEPEEIFYIKKVPDEKYQNMFIVRPRYFI
ncbi:MAG: DUF2130 domain-containing protein, partial [Malacoplasma sp.]|nr:DUF2130 domain-containing protein [Malacoplasma sp.]